MSQKGRGGGSSSGSGSNSPSYRDSRGTRGGDSPGRGGGSGGRGRGGNPGRGGGRGGPKPAKGEDLGIKIITSILMPKEYWDINGIRDIRVFGTAGLPPKIEAPHITLLDTFSVKDRCKEAVELFTQVASEIPPFEVTLKELCHFKHGEAKGYTLYLNPEIAEIVPGKTPLQLLYDNLMKRCPHFTWLENRSFSPHVSLGKIKTAEDLATVKKKYGDNWQTIKFTVSEFQVMSKLMHDTVVRFTIPLGKSRDLTNPCFPSTPFPSGAQFSININWIPAGSTKDELLNVFKMDGAVAADLVFKSLGSDASYSKGWGHVIFPNRDLRDRALKKSFRMGTSNLEIFPCD